MNIEKVKFEPVIKYIGLMRKGNIPKLTKVKIQPDEEGKVRWPTNIIYENSQYVFLKICGMTRAIYIDVDYNTKDEAELEPKTREELLAWENKELKKLLETARETLESMGFNVERIKGVDDPEPPGAA